MKETIPAPNMLQQQEKRDIKMAIIGVLVGIIISICTFGWFIMLAKTAFGADVNINLALESAIWHDGTEWVTNGDCEIVEYNNSIICL